MSAVPAHGASGSRLIALAALLCSAAAAQEAAPWSAVDSQSARTLEVPGWRCQQAVDVAPAATTWAACRRSGNGGPLRLVQWSRPDGGMPPRPRDLAGLGDATQAQLRVFVPAQSCEGRSAPCLSALVLVDQRDESSCYGTQVFALWAGKAPRSLGFIDELRAAEGPESCSGGHASVSGTVDGARIALAGPLWRAGRDGTPRALAESAVEYRVSANATSLRRQPPRR